MMLQAGIKSVAVSFPPTVRTNDYWRTHHPEMVREVVERAQLKVWSPPSEGATVGPFLQEMARYLGDPFRGTVERRVLAPGETAGALELDAARQALSAAKLQAQDIDLVLCAPFLADHIGVGNGAFLAGELGISGPAWNVETACAGALASLQLAASMVASGQARNVLVVTSCTYSRTAEETDTLSWTCGDGAAAMVVSATSAGRGILGSKMVNTFSTCSALYYELFNDASGHPGIRMKNNEQAGRLIREVSEECVQTCCRGACEAAGVKLDDIAHFVFNTPTAWYMRFCARALNIDPERSIDTYPRYANVGPVLMPANLHALVQEGRVKRGDLVLLYSIGSVSSAGAMVLRWDGA